MFSEILTMVLRPDVLLCIFCGVIVGQVFGCIPGLNAPIAIALALPITYALNSTQSMGLILGLYCGCVSGGMISAILLKIPGTAASVATCFDGYPMAQKGKATEALSIAAFSSFFGGIFSAICLLLLASWLANLALAFGPWEYFGTAFLSLALVCFMFDNRMLKAMIACCIGFLLKFVGVSPVDGVAIRYTFGIPALENGFQLVVVIISVFAIPEMFKAMHELKVKPTFIAPKKKLAYLPSGSSIKNNIKTLIVGSITGTFIGILPGMGGGAASLISYEQARKMSKHPEQFGTGAEDGIYSCESANNATTGGALIPMLALGVPGDTSTAVILGALMLQGIATGPLLIQTEPLLFRAMIFMFFIANILMFLFQIFTVPYMAKITKVPKYYLFPIITMFCLAGSISIRNNTFDLVYMILFGILGYIFTTNDYPIAPFILAFVLGEMVEGNYRRAIVYYGDFFSCMHQMSIGTLFVILAVALTLFMGIMQFARWHRSQKKIEGAEA